MNIASYFSNWAISSLLTEITRFPFFAFFIFRAFYSTPLNSIQCNYLYQPACFHSSWFNLPGRVTVCKLREDGFYPLVHVVTEYSFVHVAHFTLQHQTNLHLQSTCFSRSSFSGFRLHEVHSDRHLFWPTSSPLHVLPSIPGDPTVRFLTQ